MAPVSTRAASAARIDHLLRTIRTERGVHHPVPGCRPDVASVTNPGGLGRYRLDRIFLVVYCLYAGRLCLTHPVHPSAIKVAVWGISVCEAADGRSVCG
jgi:hypothetical protein